MTPKLLLVAVLALSVLDLSLSFQNLVPLHQELIYDWQVHVRASPLGPTQHASLFLVHGKVHLQGSLNSTYVQLTDLTYKMHNGVMYPRDENHIHEIPVQMEGIGDPFQVVHDTRGIVAGVVMKESEPEYVKNMKKAIANVLQIHKQILEPPNWNHNMENLMVTVEPSIYGNFENKYVARKLGDDTLHIKKVHNMHTADHLYESYWSLAHNVPCGHHDDLNHISYKEYTVGKNQGQYVVRNIHSVGAVVYQPHDGHSNQYVAMTNQTWVLDKVVPIQNMLDVHDGKMVDLTYQYGTLRSDGAVVDITNGRQKFNFEKMLPNIQNLLNLVSSNLQHNHLNTDDMNIEKSQAMTFLEGTLLVCSKENLITLQKTLTDVQLKVFYRILPLVGSKASLSIIKDIITKNQVKEEIAVQMLQNLAEITFNVNEEVLPELEVLINMDEMVPWRVRKVAIITFGTLVYKAHLIMKKFGPMIHKTNTVDYQTPFKKYVDMYVNKLKTTQDFDHQMAYILGLSNMKMLVVQEQLLRLFYGDWTHDHHLRVVLTIGLGLTGHTTNETNLMEYFWPIFVNPNEHVHIRLLAFSYFMSYRPSAAKLLILVEHMVLETNHEVYNYVYTYLKEMSESTYDCDYDFKIEVGKVVKLLRPPTHGISFAQIDSHKDVNGGFGTSVGTYVIVHNKTLSYGVVVRKTSGHVSHYDYGVHILVDGVFYKGNPFTFVMNLIKNKHSPESTKNLHIQFIISRNGRFLESYSFNDQTIHTLDNLLKFFTQESHTLEEETFRMGFDEHNIAVIPSELGVPIMWSQNVPYATHNHLKIVKETVNKIVKIHFENRYQTSVNPMHQLKVYNPFADFWQGVAKVHALDIIIPINFDVTVNLQQQSVQISWKKQNDPKWDTAGFKNHIKQIVFVYDHNESGALTQSSPHSQRIAVVNTGKKYQHEDSSLSTGVQWNMVLYDFDGHMTNGTSNKLLSELWHWNPSTSSNPLRLGAVFLMNYYDFMKEHPKPGNAAVLLKVEPSQAHHVTQVDLSLRLHSEISEEKRHFYTKKAKWSGRVTYAVKSGDTNLKTWDVNGIVDSTDGHMINSVKMFLTRIIPGQKDYKICIDGVKKWTPSGISGQVNVAMGQTECTKDVVLDITMSGHKSQQQQQATAQYPSCHQIQYYYLGADKHTLQCLVDRSTTRHYIYKIKSKNMPSEFKKSISQWWDTIKAVYWPYYQFEDEHDEHLEQYSTKIDVVYPIQVETADVKITTSQHVHELSGVPITPLKWLGVGPDSMEYSVLFQWLHQLNLVDHCTIHTDYHVLNDVNYKDMVPSEWTLYVGNHETNPTVGVFVKQITGEYTPAVKIVDHSHTVEIIPHGRTNTISLDGEITPMGENNHKDWVNVHLYDQNQNYPVAVIMQDSELLVKYNNGSVDVVVPKVDETLYGHCYVHN